MDHPGGRQAADEAEEVGVVALPEVPDAETKPAPGLSSGDLESRFGGRQLGGGWRRLIPAAKARVGGHVRWR